MSGVFADKISIKTLKDVFTSFKTALGPAINNLNFDFNSFSRNSVIFPYEGKNWRATITKEISFYTDINGQSAKKKFVNVKLPNDGYIYTHEYLSTEYTNALSLAKDITTSFIEDMESIVPFEGGEVEMYYKLEDGRLELYYFKDDENIGFTIKFEYGTYENFVSHKRYTRDELTKIYKK